MRKRFQKKKLDKEEQIKIKNNANIFRGIIGLLGIFSAIVLFFKKIWKNLPKVISTIAEKLKIKT